MPLIGKIPEQLKLYYVDASGVLKVTEHAALNPNSPDLRCFPYGSVILPTADASGNAVIVFVQPGQKNRVDVIILEKPAGCSAISLDVTEASDPRPRGEGRCRVRIPMEPLTRETDEQPSSVAIVRLAVRAAPAQPLPEAVLQMLASLRYTIRIGDQVGWFECGDDAFPESAFRHGFPDIATRNQGIDGIRGPSLFATGLQRVIEQFVFNPKRLTPIDPSERVIYEIHIGTFTVDGTLSAAAARLEYLQQKGFTTLLLMPIDIGSGFPGWTYDQTRTGAVEGLYGGAEALVDFVTKAHMLGIEVILDKQYNHRGPEQDSRPEILAGIFDRRTIWGPGLSGAEAEHFGQIMRLLGEDMAAWVANFGIDGFRFDATNRLPWEVHEGLAAHCRRIGDLAEKSLFLVSEYAESEDPRGQRVPTGCQYTDQTGRYLIKMFDLSRAQHITELALENGSLLCPMLKAARRGWWYPDIPPLVGSLRTNERACALLWHHDWIGNRFHGERLSNLLTFSLYKVVAVWQFLGQWIPILFMGTERFVRTPWFFFTGHKDEAARNHTSAYYESENGRPVLKGGRFHEFWREAHATGFREPIFFSSDGSVAGIQWDAFRSQRDTLGKPYMDHARAETFNASKLVWDQEPLALPTERLFELVLQIRRDPRIGNNDPRDAQYKAWKGNERVFLLRRRSAQKGEIVALFNLSERVAEFRIDDRRIELIEYGIGYIVTLSDGETEEEWNSTGRYKLLLDSNDERFGGERERADESFAITEGSSQKLEIPSQTVWVFSRD